jgi:hypothetical protein
VLDEADHIIVLNHPDVVAGAIEQFLESPLADAFLRTKPSA